MFTHPYYKIRLSTFELKPISPVEHQLPGPGHLRLEDHAPTPGTALLLAPLDERGVRALGGALRPGAAVPAVHLLVCAHMNLQD